MNIKELIEKMIGRITNIKDENLKRAELIVAEGIKEINKKLDNIKNNEKQLEFDWRK